MVRRFTAHARGFITPADNGGYVMYADYCDLEAELALVKEERDRFLYVKNLTSQASGG